MRNHTIAIAASLTLALGGLIAWLLAPMSEPSAAQQTTLTSAAMPAPASNMLGASATSSTGPYSAEGLQARQTQRSALQQRYERAEQVYSSYREATRYPHESRPIAEHADQTQPFAPIGEEKIPRNSATGEAIKGLRLRTTQERVFMGGQESAWFSLQAVDEAGKPLALSITKAWAQSVPAPGTAVAIIRSDMVFTDDGTLADAKALDGIYTTRLLPIKQGFASYGGTIQVMAQISAGGQQSAVQFDVVYNPQVPAVWTGMREAMESGSLVFYAKAQVAQAGRYVVSARVDDANGQPFALLQYNDEVAAGPREFKLQLFGALVRDKKPAFPLRLRDIDGFLLIPDKFPDRANLSRWSGVVHTSASYALERFSDAEWSSEERSRYLTEYGKDVEEARRRLEELQIK